MLASFGHMDQRIVCTDGFLKECYQRWMDIADQTQFRPPLKLDHLSNKTIFHKEKTTQNA